MSDSYSDLLNAIREESTTNPAEDFFEEPGAKERRIAEKIETNAKEALRQEKLEQVVRETVRAEVRAEIEKNLVRHTPIKKYDWYTAMNEDEGES